MNMSYPTARTISLWTLCFAIFLIFTPPTPGQTPQANSSNNSPASTLTPTPTPTATRTRNPEKDFFVNILRDQRAIWTSPFHLNRGDAKWAIPLTLSFAGLLASDRHTSGELVENGDNLSRLRISRDISHLGAAYTTGGVAAGFYLIGRATHNARARETGVLAMESLIDSTIVVEALKGVSQRQRPTVDNSSGEFFDGGSDFPSGHTIAAWSVATVIAQEYGQHRPLVRIGAYGLATAVGIARYTGRNHFLSDVLAGAAMGYGIGRYRKHHDPTLDSLDGKQTSSLFHSRLFPLIAPHYNPGTQTYGAMLAWEF
jgi:membrane-associated phospholipid phosphatase